MMNGEDKVYFVVAALCVLHLFISSCERVNPKSAREPQGSTVTQRYSPPNQCTDEFSRSAKVFYKSPWYRTFAEMEGDAKKAHAGDGLAAHGLLMHFAFGQAEHVPAARCYAALTALHSTYVGHRRDAYSALLPKFEAEASEEDCSRQYFWFGRLEKELNRPERKAEEEEATMTLINEKRENFLHCIDSDIRSPPK